MGLKHGKCEMKYKGGNARRDNQNYAHNELAQTRKGRSGRKEEAGRTFW